MTQSRLPLNTLGIAFGLSGLAGTWTTAAAALGAPHAIGELLWLVAAVAWFTLLARYATGISHPRDVAEDLRHPALGPFAALAPATGSLLAAHLATFLPTTGAVLVWLLFAVSTAFGAWFVAGLLTVQRPLGTLHGGYLLPTVAASLLSAQSLATIGQRHVALVVFAAGILFWLLIGAVLLARFATGPELPAPLLPTLAIFSAPPAVAGNAWWAIDGPHAGVVHDVLLGTMVVLLLPHLFLLRRYARLPFAIGFWAFTFTAAASATYGIRLLTLTPSAPHTTLAWLVLAAGTGLVGSIAIRSLGLLHPHFHLPVSWRLS
ncbi:MULTISPECIES: C4-dicarboxylate transporter [Amycolatopsis]|uniref:Tellurite resistance protein n=2 Tax=Amycolatopsis TaxID=1813 RepID=A0A1I3YJ39_9PSEU|nr:C4-dicarboxylate transporter [Amycolatopsis sacchari]SFK31844.1 tellurite resistance protein [Amycolatopsis sacchari]